MGFLKKVGKFVNDSAKKFAAVAAGAIGILTCSTAKAEGAVTANSIVMPDGIDIPQLITSGVAVLGGVVAVALAAWGGWVLVKKCLGWVRRAF